MPPGSAIKRLNLGGTHPAEVEPTGADMRPSRTPPPKERQQFEPKGGPKQKILPGVDHMAAEISLPRTGHVSGTISPSRGPRWGTIPGPIVPTITSNNCLAVGSRATREHLGRKALVIIEQAKKETVPVPAARLVNWESVWSRSPGVITPGAVVTWLPPIPIYPFERRPPPVGPFQFAPTTILTIASR